MELHPCRRIIFYIHSIHHQTTILFQIDFFILTYRKRKAIFQKELPAPEKNKILLFIKLYLYNSQFPTI